VYLGILLVVLFCGEHFLYEPCRTCELQRNQRKDDNPSSVVFLVAQWWECCSLCRAKGLIMLCPFIRIFFFLNLPLLCSWLSLPLNLTRIFLSSRSLFLSFQVALLPASAPQRLVQMRLSNPFWSRPKESCRCRKLVSRGVLLVSRGL